MLGQAVQAHLHNEISEQQTLVETFAFVDPGSTYHLNANFEKYIVERLKEGNPDRLFFWPHNQNAIKTFNSETGRSNKPPKAKFLSWLAKSRVSYTEEQLDEVRIEALQFCQDHI
ncbi:hypothetical protein ACET3Z_031402 [Daucus carota]